MSPFPLNKIFFHFEFCFPLIFHWIIPQEKWKMYRQMTRQSPMPQIYCFREDCHDFSCGKFHAHRLFRKNKGNNVRNIVGTFEANSNSNENSLGRMKAGFPLKKWIIPITGTFSCRSSPIDGPNSFQFEFPQIAHHRFAPKHQFPPKWDHESFVGIASTFAKSIQCRQSGQWSKCCIGHFRGYNRLEWAIHPKYPICS